MSFKNKILSYDVGEDGIALITINMEDHPTNLFSPDFMETYFDISAQAVADDKVKGVIVSSSRSMFMAGADLKILEKPITDPEPFFDNMMNVHRHMRNIETGGTPFVAVINGHALGGGLEVCLACHHRIAVDNPKTKIGFPEIKVGLFPGAGGTAKAPYLMGIQAGMMALLQGRDHNPKKAKAAGLIDNVVASEADLIPAAKAWIAENANPVQPWDNKKHKIPGGGLMTPNGVQTMMGGIGNVRKLTHGNYPAAGAILSTIHDGLQVKFDRALEVEARYFTQIIMSKEARNMIRTGFFAIQEAGKGKGKPAGYEKYEVKKLGVLGAGMMGAGIAYVSAALAGMDVVLKDVSIEGAEKGKAYSEALLKKRVSRGKTTQEKADGILAKITPTTDPADMKGCDMVIEAVFENPDLKAKVTAETEAVLDADKIYGSNTSTIPITLLAKASDRPENFIGIHFFSPVDKMPLVEIIVGEKTSDKAIAAAIDYVVAIRKVPIVVNDSRGFFTSRTFGTYCSEGGFLLEEGVPAAMIENVAKFKGMPVGPLAVTDEVSLTLGLLVYESDPTEKLPFQERFYKIGKMMVDEHGRHGKKNGKGFYDYPEGGKKRLWPELSTIFKSDVATLDKETVGKRLLHRMALETFRCLDEGVLRSVKDGDIGSILGFGFPIYTGGALSYIDYVGMDVFIADCDDFTERFGERFTVPAALREFAKAGKSIHDYGKETLSKSEIQKMKEVDLVEFAKSIGLEASVDDLKKETLERVYTKLGY